MAIQETIADKGSVTFDDVAGLEEAKQTLREAIVMPLQFPHLFTGEYCLSTDVTGSVKKLRSLDDKSKGGNNSILPIVLF